MLIIIIISYRHERSLNYVEWAGILVSVKACLFSVIDKILINILILPWQPCLTTPIITLTSEYFNLSSTVSFLHSSVTTALLPPSPNDYKW